MATLSNRHPGSSLSLGNLRFRQKVFELRKGSADVAGFDLIDHSDEMSIERLVERFVTVQVETLMGYDVVRRGVGEGRLHVGGAVYDPCTGQLRVHRKGTDAFRVVERADGESARPTPGYSVLTGA